MYSRIIVPLDGSDLAERALLEAERLAAVTRAPIHLVRVVDVSPRERAALALTMDGAHIGLLLAEEEAAASAYLAWLTGVLVEQGIVAVASTLVGDTVERIVGFASPGDIVIMNTHGRSGLKRWFMGSIAEEILRRASVPVLLTRATSYTDLKPVVIRTAHQVGFAT